MAYCLDIAPTCLQAIQPVFLSLASNALTVKIGLEQPEWQAKYECL